MRIIALVGISVLLVVLGFEAVKQVKAQGPDALGSLPLGFVVVDSTRKPIGPVIGMGTGIGFAEAVPDPPVMIGALSFIGPTVVAIPFHGKDLPVYVLRNSLGAPFQVFTSSDCTGQPYAFAGASPFPATALSPDNMLYVENGPGESLTINSAEGLNLSCEAYASGSENVVPVAPAINLNVFKPPFSVVGRSLLP
jgi:hypothetical protein